MPIIKSGMTNTSGFRMTCFLPYTYAAPQPPSTRPPAPMPSRFLTTYAFLLLLAVTAVPAASQSTPDADSHANFDVAIYARVYEVRQMADLDWLRERVAVMDRHLHVDQISLEVHRSSSLASYATTHTVPQFLAARGIGTAGGITLTLHEPNRLETFCYSNPEHRQWVQEVVEHTARHFDELILDDFFFTSCKSEGEIAAKGDRSWTEYRLELLDEVARNVIIGPAKAVNPDVQVVIKYPNWYAHFQGLGFNLETEPALFDKLYTGTETRDAVRSAQHLQPYLG